MQFKSGITKVLISRSNLFILVCSIFFYGCGGGSDSTENKFTVLSAVPDEGLGSVSIDTKLEVIFSKPVSKKSVTNSTFWVIDEHSHEKLQGKFELSADLTKVDLIPESLLFDRHYTVTVHHSITDTAGEHLSATRKWSFVTQPRPAVRSYKPSISATEINTNSSIGVEFETEINSASLNSSTFKLQDANGVIIPASITLNKIFAELKPQQPLRLNSIYYVRFEPEITDLNGDSIFGDGGLSYSFTTRQMQSSTFMLGTIASEEIRATAVDAQNSVYVAGSTQGNFPGNSNQGESDAFVAKYSASGLLLWANQFGTPLFDTITSMQLSEAGDIYVSGHSDDINTNNKSEMFFAKINSAGQLDGDLKKFGDQTEHDFSSNIIKDSFNYFYVSGMTMGALPNNSNQGMHDIVLAKFDAFGTQQWAKQYGSTDDETVIATLSSNNIIYLIVQSTKLQDPKNDPGVSAPCPPFDPHCSGLFFGPETDTYLYSFSTEGVSLRERIKIGTQVIPILFNGTSITTSGQIALAGILRSSSELSFSESPFVALVNTIDGTMNPITVSSEDFSFSFDSMAIDSQNNFYLAGSQYVEPSFTDPSKGPDFGKHMKLVIKKISTDPNVTSPFWTTYIPVTEHATITNLLVDNLTGDVIASGNAYQGVDGNTGIGEQDGFVIRLNGASGSLK